METRKKVPAAALRFNAGAFELAESQPEQQSVPVKLIGRTGKPIAHWYWGNVVHDLAGMKLHKASLPIDYCHNVDEVIGYLNQFDITSGDLVASGAMVPFTEADRAREVIHKAKAGVPYEASINFSDGALRLEELKVGASATVNGQVVNGPALIIREWTLRGIAVCPYGADMNTRTEFGSAQDNEIEVCIFQGGQMPDNTNVNTPQTPPSDAAHVSAPQTKTDESPAQPKPGENFIKAFGDQGARWFLEGKAFETCATEFIAQKNERITQLEGEVKQLKEQLAATPRGNEPAAFQAEKKDVHPREAQFRANLGDNLGRVAAGIKLPNAKKDDTK